MAWYFIKHRENFTFTLPYWVDFRSITFSVVFMMISKFIPITVVPVTV